jgi:hypothetical protein
MSKIENFLVGNDDCIFIATSNQRDNDDVITESLGL